MSRRHAALWTLLLLLLAASAAMQVLAADAGDKNWLLLTARMWLGGRRLYVDLVNPNLPFIIWLYAAPVWMAQHLPVMRDYILLGVMGVLFALLAVALSASLIRRHPVFAGDAVKQKQFMLLVAYVLVFFVDVLSFADRDDLFFIFTFPYLLRFMPSLARHSLPAPLRVAIAFLAALGFCIKPHTLIVFAAIQVPTIYRERSLSILACLENLIIYAVALAYMLCIVVFMPVYTDTILPMLLLTYGACSKKGLGVLYTCMALIFSLSIFARFRFRQMTPYRKDTLYFIGLAYAFYVYALFGNGWSYTYNPLLCMLLFTAGWVAWEYDWLDQRYRRHGRKSNRWMSGMRACCWLLLANIAYGIYCIAGFFASTTPSHLYSWSSSQPFVDYVQEHRIPNFGTISMDFDRWTELADRTGASWDTRFNHLWMLPKLVQEGDLYTWQHEWIVRYVGKSYADDMNARKPAIMVVDNSPGFYRSLPHVDLLAFLSVVPEFKEAWRDYRLSATIDTCQNLHTPVKWECRFDIYSRNTSGESQNVPQR